MDPITHAVSGLTVSYCLPEQIKRQHIFCIIAASLPDIDNLSFLFGKEIYLLHHRGFCHSFFGGMILSIILTGIYRYIYKDSRWLQSLFISYALVCLHLFLDLITSYGTQLFSPFSFYRCAIPCVFIIDFFFTGVLILGVVLSYVSLKYRKTIAMGCVCFILIYPIFGKIIQGIQLERAKAVLQQDNQSIHVLPAFLAPLYWKIIVDNDSHYELRHLSIFSAIEMYPSHQYDKAHLNTFIQQSPKNSLLKTYAWFFDYPALLKNKTNLQIIDLKFISANPRLHSLHDKKNIPFMLNVSPDIHTKGGNKQ